MAVNLDNVFEGLAITDPKKATDEFNLIMDFIGKQLKKSLVKHGHKASGNLYQSLGVDEKGSGWYMKALGQKVKIVLELPKYYEALDQGRKPTKNKMGGLVQKSLVYKNDGKGWIAHKGLVPASGLDFKFKYKLKNGTIKTYTKHLNRTESNIRLSFMIANKIHKHGYKGTGWFSSEMKSIREEVQQKVSDAIGRNINISFIIGKY